MKTKEENPTGLHRKYQIQKADGTPCDPEGVYFVLRLDFGDCDQEHDPEHIAKREHIRACRAAVYTFCNQTQNAQLSRELRQLLRDTELDMSDWGEGPGQV